MVRKDSRRIFLLALGITLIVFLGGLYAGVIISEEKINYLRESLRKTEREFQKYRTTLMIQENFPEKNCDILSYRNRQLAPEISKMNDRISNYDRTKKFEHPEDFESLREDYALLYIQYWLQMKKSKEICGSNITTILYFYSNEDCPSCEGQGKVLDYWKKQYENDLLIFPLATDLELDSIDMLLKAYEIESLPSLVVNENKTYEGFQSKRKVGEILENASN